MATGLYIAMVFHPNPLSGVAEHTHQMMRHLTELGEEITVLAPALPEATEFDKDCGYPVVRFDTKFPTGEWIKSRLDRRLILFGIFRCVLSLKPDYIILDMWGPLASLSAILVSRIYNIPLFVFAHGPDLNQPRYKKYIRRVVLSAVSKVICVSEYTRSFLLRWGVEPQRAVTIHSGFDVREMETYRSLNYRDRFPLGDSAFPDDHPTVLSVSRLVQGKGIHRVIEAMPKVISEVPDTRYIIVGGGGGNFEIQLRELAEVSSARDSITFLGPVSGDQKFECFSRGDVFVLPSEGEAFGIVFVEAMGFGMPVIGGRSGGAMEVIAHGENGLLVDSNDVEEIADAIIYLLKNPDESRRLGENGRRRVENELNWTTSANKLRSVIYDTLGESG